MGIEFEKLKKKKFPTDRPIPEKQGRVRGNKNIFKVGLIDIFTRRGYLKGQGVLISAAPSLGDKVICRHPGFTFQTII